MKGLDLINFGNRKDLIRYLSFRFPLKLFLSNSIKSLMAKLFNDLIEVSSKSSRGMKRVKARTKTQTKIWCFKFCLRSLANRNFYFCNTVLFFLSCAASPSSSVKYKNKSISEQSELFISYLTSWFLIEFFRIFWSKHFLETGGYWIIKL